MPSLPNNLELRLQRLLPHVTKPARYVGGEVNSVVKRPETAIIRVALAFPDVYEVAMSNLALAILYDALNSRQDTWAERVFAPWSDAEKLFRDASIPLFSLESHTPVREFDILGFTLGFELCYTNVLNMLDQAGLPIYSADRNESHPLVIAGGHATTAPEPMAPFIDAFVIGDGEQVIHEIVDLYGRMRGRPRSALLRSLANLQGVYVPAFYRTEDRSVGAPTPVVDGVSGIVERRYVEELNSLSFPTRPVVPSIEVVHDRISIEVMRGCARGCRFCQAGMITRPVRERNADEVMSLAHALVRATGHEEISLVSLSTSDHSEIAAMVERLIAEFAGEGVGVSLPSLRADQDCVALAQRIQTVRKSGLTFAPEAGSQRLRNVINKGVTEEDLMRAAESAFRAGWRHIKLYFMIGLPTETDEDLTAIGELGSRVAMLGRRYAGRSVSVAVSVSGFVPKPHTPFQWRAQDAPEELRRKQRLVRQSVRDRAVTLKFHDPEAQWVEGVLARGGREVARAIAHAWRTGARFDAWSEHFSFNRWLDAFSRASVDSELITGRVRGYHEPLAWDHIHTGVSKGYLRAEDRRAERAELTGDCHSGPCTLCQACPRWISEGRSGHELADAEGG